MRRVRRRAGRVGAIVSIWIPCQAGLSWSSSALVALRGPAPGKIRPSVDAGSAVAPQILQAACRDIGQLTDFEAAPRPANLRGRRPGRLVYGILTGSGPQVSFSAG